MNKKSTKMVSLDTSTAHTGYAYWKNGKLSAYGVIDSVGNHKTGDKTDDMMLKIDRYLKEKIPDIVVVEMTVVPKNAHTQRELTELIGGIRNFCLLNKIGFFRLRPTQWRKLVREKDEKLPKKREELKAWSRDKVKLLYNADVTDDTSDSILIGAAYIKMFEVGL